MTKLPSGRVGIAGGREILKQQNGENSAEPAAPQLEDITVLPLKTFDPGRTKRDINVLFYGERKTAGSAKGYKMPVRIGEDEWRQETPFKRVRTAKEGDWRYVAFRNVKAANAYEKAAAKDESVQPCIRDMCVMISDVSKAMANKQRERYYANEPGDPYGKTAHNAKGNAAARQMTSTCSP